MQRCKNQEELSRHHSDDRFVGRASEEPFSGSSDWQLCLPCTIETLHIESQMSGSKPEKGQLFPGVARQNRQGRKGLTGPCRSRSGRGQYRLQGFECFEYLLVMPVDFNPFPNSGNFTAGVDQIGAPLYPHRLLAVHVLLPPRTIFLGYAMIGVGK